MSNRTWLSTAAKGFTRPNASFDRLYLPRSSNLPLPYMLAYGIIATLVVFLNGLVLLIFIKKREVRKRKSNLFLCSLSAADFLVGVSSIFYLACVQSKSLTELAKKISTVVLGFSLETSMFSLCCITYERLIGVKDSLKYQKLVTSGTVKAAIIFTWVLSVVMSSMQGILAFKLEEGRYFELNGVVIVVLANIISIFLAVVYIYFYHEIRRHCRNMRNTSVSVTCSLDLDLVPTRSLEDTLDFDKSIHDVTAEPIVPKKKHDSLLSLSREKRSLILCSFIVCSFIVCWTPITVFFAALMLDQQYMTKDFMLYISTCIVSLNSLLDPCIYFALRNDLRRAALSVLCRTGHSR